MTFPITKHNYFVNDKEDLADALRNAFRIANEGRKGPVLVDITKDVTEAIVDYEPAKPYPIRKTETENCEAKAEKFAKYINGAQKPVIQVGGGVIASESYREVMELARCV